MNNDTMNSAKAFLYSHFSLILLLALGFASAFTPAVRAQDQASPDQKAALKAVAQMMEGQRTYFQKNGAWLTDTSPRPLATERVSVHWVGREP